MHPVRIGWPAACWSSTAVAAVLALACPAAADPPPWLALEVPVELQLDRTYRSDDTARVHTQLFTTIEPAATIRLGSGFSVFAHAVIDPMSDPPPRESRYIEEHGGYVEDLTLRYDGGAFALFAGKFTPNFGRAWDIAPGIYGTDAASDTYEFSERIGIGGSVNLPVPAGEHVLSASTFFLDTSPLAHSLGQTRGTRGHRDGGIGNTEDLSSFAVALDGTDALGVPDLSYHAAVIRQRAGLGQTADERGMVVAGAWSLPLSADIALIPLVEVARFEDADGARGRDRDMLTLAGQFTWERWSFSVSFTGRRTDDPGAQRVDDSHLQMSAGYALAPDVGIEAGWLLQETDEVQAAVFGMLFTYTFSVGGP